MASVTRAADAAIRSAIQDFKIGRATGNTNLARACSPIRIATENEELVPLHTKQISRKTKAHIEVVACSRNQIHRSIAPNSTVAFDTNKALRANGVLKETSPR